MNPANSKIHFITKYWPAVLIGLAWGWMFWPMMSGQTVCGFRDSAYLYFPLFKWIDAQWAAGEIPLWNPYCNFGMPVVGDGSSSVFYPGKLIFLCRFLTFPSRYGIYLAIHVLIAASGTYWLAKTFRANKPGATLAAIGYAFGGSVIFQVTNVIFLVSAAWLPFAILCVWKMVRTRKSTWAIWAGVFCALMILGGDPQMVYHVGLIAVATIVFEVTRVGRRRFRTRNRWRDQARPDLGSWTPILSQLKVLLLMILVTSSIAAIQILPTFEWSKRSERTNPTEPANLYQLMVAKSTPTKHALISEPIGTIDHTYQFSREPWSMAELFWPNFSGKPFPINQRWTSRFPGTERIWVPSIYMGVLVSLFGLAGFRLWGRRRRNVWLTWMFLFFCIASFGWYGAVWLLNEFQIDTTVNGATLGPQVGGLYWLMQLLLPKYFAFRYPAKLFVIASLALAVLAGINLRRIRPLQWLMPFSIFGIGLLAIYRFISQVIPNDPAYSPHSPFSIADPTFGPYDASGCLREFSVSLFQALFVIVIGLLVFGLLERFFQSPKRDRGSSRSIRLSHAALVVLTMLDLAVANGWMLAEVSPSAFESPTEISRRIEEATAAHGDPTPLPLFRHRYAHLPPVEWENTVSSQRLSEVIKWQRESLYPKHHLEHNVMLLGSFSSVWPSYHEKLLTNLERDYGDHGLFEFDKIDQAPPAFFVATESTTTGERILEYSLDVTAFSINEVNLKLNAPTKGVLMFGNIAEPGWTAEITNLESGKTNVRPMELNNELEKLTLELDQIGEYEIRIKYMPLSFVIGAMISLGSLTLLILWVPWVWFRAVASELTVPTK